MPSLTAQESVSRQWFDWTAPQVMMVSAPFSIASAMQKSSFLVLLPPAHPGNKSSRLMNTLTLAPRAFEKAGRDSIGVGP
jgi:hypothetical protein